MKSSRRPHWGWRVAAVLIFPLLVAVFALRYMADPARYIYLLREDGPVEWLTIAFLALAGLIALDIGFKRYRRQGTVDWFYFAFGLFSLVMALEEMSWGQRLFAITPPDYFLGRSDQQEINVHNVLQQQFNFKTKDLAALVLSFYGIVLPLVALNGRVAALLKRVRLVTPPLYLSVGFLTAALMMLDVPTGFEEEIGEFLFGLAFFLFMLHELARHSYGDRAGPRPLAMQSDGQAWADRFLPLAFVLATFGLHIWALDAKGLWLPEAVLAAHARAPLADLLAHGWVVPSFGLPGWALLGAGWQPLAGSSAYALRYLSVLAATAATPLLWTMLKALWPRASGQWDVNARTKSARLNLRPEWSEQFRGDSPALRSLATLLLVLSPALHFYAQDHSAYALLPALAILSLYLTIKLRQARTLPRLLFWLLTAWLLTTVRVTALALIVVEVMVLARHLGRQGSPTAKGLTALTLILALLPGLTWALTAPGTTAAWAAAARIADPEDWSAWERLAQLWKDTTFGSVLWQSFRARLSVVLVPLYLVGAVSLLAPVLAVFGVRPTERSELRAIDGAALILGPVLLTFSIAVFILPSLSSAAFMTVLPLLLITVAAGIVALWRQVPLVGAAGLLLAVGLAAVGLASYAEPGYAKSDYRAMAQFTNQAQDATDGILLMAPSQRFLAEEYLQSEAMRVVPQMPASPYWPLPPEPVIPHEVDGQIQEALRDHAALWLVLHQENTVDPGRFVQAYLTAVAYRDDCHIWRDVELCRYVSPDGLTSVPPRLFDARYADALRLDAIALRLASKSITGMPALLAELSWTATAQPTADIKVSLRLLDPAGEPLAQRDDFPIGPLLPPSTWQAGDEKPGYMLLPLPPDLPPGVYPLHIVVYDPATMTPVPHRLGDGAPSMEPLSAAALIVAENGEIDLIDLQDP